MDVVNVGLNGFGRIGRAFARIASGKDNLQIKAINTGKTSPEMLAYLLKYDSVYRMWDRKVVAENHGIVVDGNKITSYNERDPAKIPWDSHRIHIVLDCTGVFKTRDTLSKHLRGSVKKVVLSAPEGDESIPSVVLGVNEQTYDFSETDIVSNCSCTTNCAAPMFKLLHDSFTIRSGFLTTIHAYTSSQKLLDTSAKKHTRARAAALSLIPTSTGAAKAVVKVMPHLEGKIDAMAVRAPVPVGSFSDISAVVEKSVTIKQVNKIFRDSSQGNMKGILGYETTPLVSSDYIGCTYSCVLDANYTQVIGGTLIKVFGWYDNEWGYSTRLVELVQKLGDSL